MADDLTCVLTALRREGMYLRAGTRAVHEGPCPAWLNHDGVLLVQSGMGAAATERALIWALGYGAGRVIAAGFCGALAELPVGAAVWFEEVVGDLARSASEVFGTSPRSRFGLTTAKRLVSVNAPILTAAARHDLRDRTGADCVDMESATAARICRECNIPFACVRAVSDAGDLPPELADFADGERVNTLRLLDCLLRRPSLALDLHRLARDSRRAARAWPTLCGLR